MQPCLDCGTPAHAARCPRCTALRGRQRTMMRAAKFGGTDPYNNADYRRAAQEIRRTTTQCWLCGQGPRSNDPWQADHVTPLAEGKVTTELRGAHRSCNVARANKARARKHKW